MCCSSLLLIVSLLFGQALAQSTQIDSLKAQLKVHPQADTARVNRLNALGVAINDTNPALALQSLEEAHRLAERLRFIPGLALTKMNLAWYYTAVNNCPRALTFAQQAQRHYQMLGDRTGQVNSLTQMAYIHIALGSYVQSIRFAQQALGLVEPLADKSKKAYVNLLLGQLHAHLGNYAQSQTHALVGIRLAREVGDAREISRGLNILGENHRMQGQWASALPYYRQDLRQFKAYSLNKAICEGNIADVCEHLGQYGDAFRYGQQVRAYCQRIGATSYVAWIESILARAYLHTGQLTKATEYGTRSFNVAERGGLQKITSDAAEVLAEAYARQGNYAAAFRHQSRFMSLKDSLRGEETIRQTAALQYKFDLDKKQSQIALLTKTREVEQQRSQYQERLLYAAGIGVLLLLALAVVLYRNVRVKQRVNELLSQQKALIENQLTDEILVQQQKLLESQLKAQQDELRVTQAQLRIQQEKERIARDLHDHVGAQLSVIASSLDHVRLSGQLNGTAPHLEAIGNHARDAIGSLRETIWAINREHIPLGEFQIQLQQYLSRQRQILPDGQVELHTHFADATHQLTSEQALNLFRIVQEAVQNALRHACADTIEVAISTDDSNTLRLAVTDDGSGFDVRAEHPGHYGLLNMQLRAERVGGICEVISQMGRGTTLSLVMPLQPVQTNPYIESIPQSTE